MELKEWGTLITGNMGTNGRSKYSALYLLLESVQVLRRRLPVLNTGTQLPKQVSYVANRALMSLNAGRT